MQIIPPPEGDGARVLVIDDELGLRDFLRYELEGRGYSVETAADGAEALAKLDAEEFALVISDVRMPGLDGISLLGEIKRRRPRAEVVMTTGYGTVESAVEAMKLGAFDFLLKPVEAEVVAAAARRALQAGELKALVALYETSLALFRSVDLDEVLPVIADRARRLLGADRAAILLPGEDGGLRAAAAAGPPDAGFAARAAAACAGAGAADGRLLACPLAAQDAAVGFLAAERAPSREGFAAHDRRHAALFAAQAAQAVRNAELFRALESTRSRLIQSEKLNAMGRVAAGIAHEINNPLTIILGNVELVLAEAALSAESREDLAEVVSHARRCRDIVRGLLEFASRREPVRRTLELGPLVASALEIARLSGRGSAAVSLLQPAPSPRVLADETQLKQVIVNLARNALQAMEGAERPELTVRVESAGGRARVRVEDRGPGLPPAALDRLFEPFYTTKAPGQGTGLGLYLCRLLLERHGGSISAGNREGGGAVFTVELPEAA